MPFYCISLGLSSTLSLTKYAKISFSFDRLSMIFAFLLFVSLKRMNMGIKHIVWAHCGSNYVPNAYWKFRSPHCQESQGAFGTAVKYCKTPFPAEGKSLAEGLPERLSGKLLHKGCPSECQHFSLPLEEEETQSGHVGKIKIFHILGVYTERFLLNHPISLTVISVLFKGKLLSFPGFPMIAMLINTDMYHRNYS